MFKRVIASLVIVCFSTTFIQPLAGAQSVNLPAPGTMVNLSPAYEPVLMKGLKVHPENPFVFDFVLDQGDSTSPEAKGESTLAKGDYLKQEIQRLVKYFLAAMTVPEKDLWVNLSPYEKDRMIAPNLGATEMGRDMLAQDYILKQLTASLIYPEKDLGKTFWDKVYSKARQLYGNAQVPAVGTFNKVWIVADKADVFERGSVAYVVGAHLKVMLEEDYVALNKRGQNKRGQLNSTVPISSIDKLSPSVNTLASQIVRELILPEIEKEVNTGKNFTPLRQMFYSMILASWYKMALQDAILTQIYANQSKVKVGVNQPDIKANQQIFQQYLKAYKKGVFNYIKEEPNPAKGGETIPRKYFSGGLQVFPGGDAGQVVHRLRNIPAGTRFPDRAVIANVDLSPAKAISHADAAMTVKEFEMVNGLLKSALKDSGDGHLESLEAERMRRINFVLFQHPITVTTGPIPGGFGASFVQKYFYYLYPTLKNKIVLMNSRREVVTSHTRRYFKIFGVPEQWLRLDQKSLVNEVVAVLKKEHQEHGDEFVEDLLPALKRAANPTADAAMSASNKVAGETSPIGQRPIGGTTVLEFGNREFVPLKVPGQGVSKYSFTAEEPRGGAAVSSTVVYTGTFTLARDPATHQIIITQREDDKAPLLTRVAGEGENPGVVGHESLNHFSKIVLIFDRQTPPFGELRVALNSGSGIRKVTINSLAIEEANPAKPADAAMKARGAITDDGIFISRGFSLEHINNLLVQIEMASRNLNTAWKSEKNATEDISLKLWEPADEYYIQLQGVPNTPTNLAWVKEKLLEIEYFRILFSADAAMRADQAALAKQVPTVPSGQAPGGIDFNRANMQMNVNKEGPGVQMTFDPATVDRIKREGFDGLEFRIQSIIPVTNLPQFLGLEQTREKELAKAGV